MDKSQKHETRVSRQTVCALKSEETRRSALRSGRSGSPARPARGPRPRGRARGRLSALGPRGALARSAERRRSVRRAVSASYVRVCCLVSVYIVRVRHVCECACVFSRCVWTAVCVVNLHLRPCSVENDDSLQRLTDATRIIAPHCRPA